jgi:hypothetical protein
MGIILATGCRPYVKQINMEEARMIGKEEGVKHDCGRSLRTTVCLPESGGKLLYVNPKGG